MPGWWGVFLGVTLFTTVLLVPPLLLGEAWGLSGYATGAAIGIAGCVWVYRGITRGSRRPSDEHHHQVYRLIYHARECLLLAIGINRHHEQLRQALTSVASEDLTRVRESAVTSAASMIAAARIILERGEGPRPFQNLALQPEEAGVVDQIHAVLDETGRLSALDWDDPLVMLVSNLLAKQTKSCGRQSPHVGVSMVDSIDSSRTSDYQEQADGWWNQMAVRAIQSKYALYTDLIVHVIRGLPPECRQSADDSPLESVWEEFKDQVQGCESVFFAAYEETIRSICYEIINPLPVAERQLLWLGSDAYWNWNDEEGEPDEGIIQDDVVSELYRRVCSRAADEPLVHEKRMSRLPLPDGCDLQ